jgi:hypothetical protein
MNRVLVVQYQARPEQADENQRLVEQVYAELNENDPGRLQYITLRLADGVTFLHVSMLDGEDNPLSQVAAFQEFQAGLAERLAAPPKPEQATIVGRYRL